jgi:uncharacterized protein YqgQ
MDSLLEEKRFGKNFTCLFALRLPKQDMVAGEMKELYESALVDLEVHLIKINL